MFVTVEFNVIITIMLYPKIEDCIARAGNSKYVLVAMVGKRAKDLITRNAGQFTAGKEKQISYAMREVMDGRMLPVYASNQAVNAK